MHTLYLIRHGETSNNLLGLCGKLTNNDLLTNNGIEQIKKTSILLAGRDSALPLIVCSPLARAVQSAKIIANSTKSTIIQDTRLGEFNAGEWGVYPMKDALKLLNEVSENEMPCFRPPGGESWTDMEKRLKDVFQEYIPQPIVIFVTHGGPMRILTNYLLGNPIEKWLNTKDPGNGSIWKIEINDKGNALEIII